jgi:circadian clock protein KaiB
MGTKEFLIEKIKQKKEEKYVLRLFVAGISPKSLKAIEIIKKLCSESAGDFDLEIIDIYQNQVIARDGQILAAPTLIKEFPLPVRKFIGDLSDRNKLILGLDLKSKR